MKRKFLLLLAFIIACATAVTVFAFSAMAADEEIVVTYYEKQSKKGSKEVAVPNGDGTYTMRETQFSKASTVTLSDGTVVDRELYGWFTEEGDFYTPGQTVTFTKSTNLYQAYGVTVYNFSDLQKAFSAGGWVRLGCDIEGTAALTNGRTTSILDLNGFDYNVTNNEGHSWGKELGVFGCTRGSYAIMGKGTITQGLRTKDTNNGKFFASFSTHGTFDEDNPQNFWVGKDVKIVTPYPLLRIANQPKLGMPDMKIAGTIEATQLLTGPSMQQGTVDIFESADITLTGTEMITITALNANPYTYLTVTIHGGKIRMESENARIVTENMEYCCSISILGGSFAVSQMGIDTLAPYIAEPFVLKETVIDGVTYQTVSQPDCNHNYVLDAEQTTAATMTSTGKDVFVCSECGEKKEKITVYNPSNVEITIKVLVEDSVVEKTVALNSVATIVKQGVEANAFYVITAFAETDSDGNKLLSVEIPFGVSEISLTGANNTSIEEMVIADGADMRVSSVIAMQALKTLKIEAANVIFSCNCIGTNNTAFESLISDKAGATVTFEKQAFYYYTNTAMTVLKELVIADGSTYSFGDSSFAQSQIESLIFPDGATINFTGNSAFNSSKSLKYIYVGESITKLTNKQFEYCNNLECVVIMNAYEIGESLRVDKTDSAKAELAVYVHTANITTIHKNAFYNRSNYGVKFYTIDPDIVSLQNCLWTVYNGIPHAYVDGVVREPSCVLPGIVGSVTDCACGVNSVVTYTIYTAEGTETGTTAQRETELSNIHVLGTVLADVDYKNGYLEKGTKLYLCALCGDATVEEEAPSVDALFVNQGYSVCEFSSGITQSFAVNKAVYNEIKDVNSSFKFGIVVAGNADGSNSNPINVLNGAPVASGEKVYIVVFDEEANDYFDIKLIGFDDTTKDKKVIFCAYVFDGKSVEYVDNGATTDTVDGISYNDILASQK